PTVLAVKTMHLELLLRFQRAVRTADPFLGLLDPARHHQGIFQANLPERRSGRNQGSDLWHVAEGKQTGDDLSAATVATGNPLLHAVHRPGDHGHANPLVEGGGQHGHPSAHRLRIPVQNRTPPAWRTWPGHSAFAWRCTRLFGNLLLLAS